ncbi:MAG: hypothetical protein KA135_01535 [Halioglobus sp.]|nr:hypothetical protein [Halioglobus sp.]
MHRFTPEFRKCNIATDLARRIECRRLALSNGASPIGLSDRRPPWTAAAEPVHGCTLFGVSDKPMGDGSVRADALSDTKNSLSRRHSLVMRSRALTKNQIEHDAEHILRDRRQN